MALSIHFLKNPAMGSQYFKEIAARDDRAHVFHPSYGAKKPDRSTPLSTHRDLFRGLQNPVNKIRLEPDEPAGLGTSERLTVAAQSSLGKQSQPAGKATGRRSSGLCTPRAADNARTPRSTARDSFRGWQMDDAGYSASWRGKCKPDVRAMTAGEQLPAGL